MHIANAVEGSESFVQVDVQVCISDFQHLGKRGGREGMVERCVDVVKGHSV
jgi:hypothetical protein